MTRTKAQIRLSTYLKSHFIYFETDICEGTPRTTMVFKNCDNCPSKVLEACIYFYPDCMEVKTYYNEDASHLCREYQENRLLVIELFNYINATLWMFSSDGTGGALYAPSVLYTPRIFMTEDGFFDITITTLISYDSYEIAPLETEDYITAYCPELLNKLSPAIFSLLTGKVDIEQAKQYIKTLTNANS